MSEVDEAQDRVRQIRARLDQDLGALEARLPERPVLIAQAKTYGGAALGGLAALAGTAIVLKQRGDRKKADKEARRHAEAIARALPDAALRVEQHTVSSRSAPLALLVALVALGVAAWNLLNSRREAPDIYGAQDQP